VVARSERAAAVARGGLEAPGEATNGLRAGMSVSVEIDTHHQNPLPEPIAKALGRVPDPPTSNAQ
jgi:hypothetical protein